MPHSSTDPLTQAKLDTMGCSDPDCDHKAHDGGMYLHSSCHQGMPTFCHYQDGNLYVTCAYPDCGNMVAVIAVDPGTTERH